MTVNDLKEQTKQIQDYTDKLQTIKEKVSSDLFDEIAAMDIKEGGAYIDRLLAMSTKEFNAYTKAYADRQKAATKAGKSIYSEDIKKVGEDYQAAIQKAFKDMPAKLEKLGTQALQGFLDGLTKNTAYRDKNVRTFVQGIVDQFKKELQIKSPSKVTYKLGSYTGEGFNEGFMEWVSELKKTAQTAAKAVSSPLDGIKADIRGKIPQPGNDAVQGQNGPVNNYYNLVQNNSSPRPLTALQTYQARRQQIAMVKAAIM